MHALHAIDTRIRNFDFVESGEAILDRAKADADATADALFFANLNHVLEHLVSVGRLPNRRILMNGRELDV